MTTKIFLSSGKTYQVDVAMKELVSQYLTDDKGLLKQEIVHFDDFSINPTQVEALEEVDESEGKRIGY